MSGGMMFDNNVPYFFSRQPERRMYGPAPLRRGQPAYRVVAPEEHGYIPVDRHGYGVYPREQPQQQGFVPVQSFPEDHHYMYGGRPWEQVHGASGPYGAHHPQEVYYDVPYGPAPRPHSQRVPEVVPLRDGGYGRRQPHVYGPVMAPRERAWDYQEPYSGRQTDGVAFRPVYVDSGYHQPEPMAAVAMEDDQVPYRVVRVPSSAQRGGRPVAVRDVSGLPHIVVGGAGEGHEDVDTHRTVRKMINPDSVIDMLLRDGGKDRRSEATSAAVAGNAVPAVRSIHVSDGTAPVLTSSLKKEPVSDLKKEPVSDGNVPVRTASHQKEEKGKASGTTSPRQGILKKGFLVPSASKSRSTSPTSERKERKDVPVNGKEEGKGGKSAPADRTVTLPLAELENGDISKMMKAIFDAMSGGQSKSEGDKQTSKSSASTHSVPVEQPRKSVAEKESSAGQQVKVPESDSSSNARKSTVEKLSVPVLDGERVEQQSAAAGSSETVTSMCEDSGKPAKEAVPKAPLSEEDAVRKIQANFRGHSVRCTEPLEKARAIARVRSKLSELEGRIADQEVIATLVKDPKERLRLTEAVMSLLLQLDSIQGLHPSVRDLRKAVARDLTRLQDTLDTKLNEVAQSAISDDEVEHPAPSAQDEAAAKPELTAVDEVATTQEGAEDYVVNSQSRSEEGKSVPVPELENVVEPSNPAEETEAVLHEELLKEIPSISDNVAAEPEKTVESSNGAADNEAMTSDENLSGELDAVVEGATAIPEKTGDACENTGDACDGVVEVELEVPEENVVTVEMGAAEVYSALCQSVVKDEALTQEEIVEEDGVTVEDNAAETKDFAESFEIVEEREVSEVKTDSIVEPAADVEGVAKSSEGGTDGEGLCHEETLSEAVASMEDEVPMVQVSKSGREEEAEVDGTLCNSQEQIVDSEQRRELRMESGSTSETSAATMAVELADAADLESEKTVLQRTDEGTSKMIEADATCVDCVDVDGEKIFGGTFEVAVSGPLGLLQGEGSSSSDEVAIVVENERAAGLTDMNERAAGLTDMASVSTPDVVEEESCACSAPETQISGTVDPDAAALQRCKSSGSVEDMEERVLVRYLIEENKKLKSLVQTLVGLSQAQTRSVVDRLERLESRVSESGKGNHHRRKVMARRRKL